MTFLTEIERYGTLITRAKPKTQAADPRALFAKQAAIQAERIERHQTDKRGRQRGHWFERLDDGTYLVQFKRGTVALRLNGTKSAVHCQDAERASALIRAAEVAAKNGELDELLAAAARRRKQAAHRTEAHDEAT
jgi:hypothetical protein